MRAGILRRIGKSSISRIGHGGAIGSVAAEDRFEKMLVQENLHALRQPRGQLAALLNGVQIIDA